MNRVIVKEMYSGINELMKIPPPFMSRAMKDVFFLPILSARVPKTYDAKSNELMYMLPVKATYKTKNLKIVSKSY